MLIENNNAEFEAINAFHAATASDISRNAEGDSRLTQTRIRMRVPKAYRHEPIISRLISQYSLTVNVNAALLGVNSSDDGWFDLELHGTASQIESALIYLNDLDVEIWSNSTAPEEETW